MTGPKKNPRRIMLYSSHGIGKSTWGAHAPSPLFLQCENGLDDIGPPRTPLIRNYGEVLQVVGELAQEDHPYRTLVVDTIDALERIIWTHVCVVENKTSIEDFGFGKGYVKVWEHMNILLNQFEWLRQEKGLAIILLCHAKLEKVSLPGLDPFSRYEPDMHKLCSQGCAEWVDELLFANYRTTVITQDGEFGRVETKAIGDGERVVYTEERPTHLAKSRLPLPYEMPLDFNAYAQACVAATPAEEGPLTGSVVNGSSKQGVAAAG